MMRKLSALLVSLILIFAVNVCAQNLMQQADSLWEKRGDVFDEKSMIADSAIINEAIDIYKKISDSATGAEKEDATWKLIRGYYYKGKYTTSDKELKKKIYDMGKELGENSLKEFPDSPGINLFTAIVWGVWGETYGILAAAKKGVAGKIKTRCEKTIELDPNYDDAGGYRVLGRVYFKAPKIWPILRWPSKKKALEIFEKAMKIAPENLTAQQFYAEALYAQGKKDEAKKIMNNILAIEGVHEGIAEDAVLKSEVKSTLAEWSK